MADARIEITLSKKTRQRIEKLIRRTGARNVTDLIRKALHLFEVVADADEAGRWLLIIDPEHMPADLPHTQVTIERG